MWFIWVKNLPLSQVLRKLTPIIAQSNCLAIFINQLREKVGVIYGNPKVTTGGRALKFYASVRLDIRRIETLKVNGEVIGSRTRAKVVKNKVAPPFKEAEFDVLYGKGISREGEIIDASIKLGIIQKSGAWFTYKDYKLQGKDSVKELLKNEPSLAEEIKSEVLKALNLEKPSELSKEESLESSED